MIAMTLQEIADVVGGSVLGDADLVVAGGAYLDSREPVPDGLFVAIAGERVDGHDYAAGAHAVLGSRATTSPTVVVPDPVVALGLLARHVLGRIDAIVIALTGSQGKTGTKDYLAGILAAVHGSEKIVATRANHNNELGVPLTVLRADPTTTHVVVEMGARGIGHIGYLCEIAPPHVAAVLNVGTAHIGEFGSREAIAQAKGEIVEALGADGVAVLNADDPLVAAMATRTAGRVLTFGVGEEAAVRWSALALDERGRASFRLQGADRSAPVPVTLRHPGAHQVANAAAAVALGVGAGGDFTDLARALGEVDPPSRWRMEVTERADGLLLVNDAYNANPESTVAALEALSAMGAGGRRTVAVLGEMRELGAEHEAGHLRVGAAAARLGVDVLIVVGAPAHAIADGARDGERVGAGDGADAAAAADPIVAGVGEIISADGHSEAIAWLVQNAGPEDVVLVKASRGAALERVAAAVGSVGTPEVSEEPT